MDLAQVLSEMILSYEGSHTTRRVASRAFIRGSLREMNLCMSGQGIVTTVHSRTARNEALEDSVLGGCSVLIQRGNLRGCEITFPTTMNCFKMGHAP